MPRYIYDLESWPELHWRDDALMGPLAAVRHRQGMLAGRMEGLGFPLRSEAELETLTEDVVKSSEIEGVVLDAAQVRSSIASRLGIDVGALAPAERHVEGIVGMSIDATQNFAAPLTEERLFGWHAALFPTGRSGMSRIAVGAWRTERSGPMRVVSGPAGRERVHYEAPPSERVPGEMQAFIEWFNAVPTTDPVLNAALAHLRFVTIHPFEDGNGRIARAIADMALARAEGSPRRFYSMSSQIRRERGAYYTILESTQKGDLDVTPWLRWFFACLDRALDGAEETLASVMRRARFWEDHAGAALNERQRAMLNRLLDRFEGKLTTSKWAKLAKCSQDTALRDIDDLMGRGILARAPAGGRSTSYSFVWGAAGSSGRSLTEN